MPKAALYSAEGARIGEVELREDVFGGPVHEAALHQAVVAYLANQRLGTASTKTRGEVSGSGRKPWRQKGTGRARAGSIRSPLWRGGGIVFGPKPRSYYQPLPQKLRVLALKSALAARAREGNVLVIEEFRLSAPKTKEAVNLLSSLGLGGEKTLLVTSGPDPVLAQATRNLPRVRLLPAHRLNAYEVLAADKVVFSRGALEAVGEVLAGA